MEEQFDPYHKWLGIPPKDQPPNHYRLLGVELLESDLDVIENAADQRMRHVRSFQNGPHQARSQKLLNEIAAAKLCLLVKEQKDAYDSQFAMAMPTKATPPVANAAVGKPAVAKPAVVKVSASPAISTSSSVSESAKNRKGKAKNPLLEIVKVIAGGAAGLLIGVLILGFLREDWDMFGIAKAMRGSGKKTETSSLNDPPVQPPVVDPIDKQSNDPPKTLDKKQTNPGTVKPPTVKLTPLSGIVEAKTFVEERGQPPINLGPPQDSFVVTSWVAGYFLGNGEWFNCDVDGDHYTLHVGGVQPMGCTITRVSTPYREWFEDEVKKVVWRKGEPRQQLIHQHDGFAVLSGASGCFLGPEHSVKLYLDPDDGYWYLEGATNFDTKGYALVYRFKEPGRFRAEVKQFDWKPGDERQQLIPIEDGLCFVSALSGAFKGYGENLNAMAEMDGYWHVWGYSKAGSTRGAFTSIRFNTPEMLAMSPTPPDLKIGEKTPPPIVEPEPMPEVKGPPPADEELASALEKVRETLQQTNVNALLSAAAEKRPAAERYLILVGARDRAIAASDCQAALRVIDKLAEKFEVDAFALRVEALQQLGETCETPESNVQLGRACLTAIDQAKQAKNKEQQLALAQTCITAARKTKDADLNSRATLELLEARK